MYLRHLSLGDFRSYHSLELALSPGVTTLVGYNGQGKTNVIESIGYLATLGSHRVAQDGPLVRFGAARAVVRGAVVKHGREQLLEIEIVPGRANRAKMNRSPVPRPRDVLGAIRTVLFAPEDLTLVKGEPAERRRFLDDLLVSRQPRWAGVRADYDKIVRQRNALLRSATAQLRQSGRRSSARSAPGMALSAQVADALHTLDVWDDQLAGVGSHLLYARLRLLRDLRPFLTDTYEQVSSSPVRAHAAYKSSLGDVDAERIAQGEVPEQEELREAMLRALAAVRSSEIERGVSLTGPHRDDVVLTLGDMPAKGYASHGESWSLALGLRLAAFQLLRRDLRDDPVLILDDVFAELDARRREKLASMIVDAEQVVITAAVPEDVPEILSGATCRVEPGQVISMEGPTSVEEPSTSVDISVDKSMTS
ncbi:DNA replication and repair protein RecF [Austwickia sp. TVS 96-490-7B]|uniref:DNA replication/repair protein RecF n=1 Tax=Austwickia sp. TVS 96-490-7B TaxID=2830843 RepID=UPI001C563FD4|nr:DNA replication/repair protein RecF [Austwickia sp. TVS 96-490-7B]MBW3084178.1 DNA replication and repair protein RecF [Austwickia sp. TVS 96-490-7B]